MPAAAPSTSADSTDTLPTSGYTRDQLANYIFRQLGYPTWNVELSQQQVLDCIDDAMRKISIWRPRTAFVGLTLDRTTSRYLVGVDCRVVEVQFAEPLPTPTAIFYGNLIDPAPLFRTGLDDYDMFMRWRVTWMRVTSVQPDWHHDAYNKVLYIHNPIERYGAAALCYKPWTDTVLLPGFEADWVKDYATAKAHQTHGNVFAKFGNAIPGPVQQIALDAQKRDKADEKIKNMEEELKKSQVLTPITLC